MIENKSVYYLKMSNNETVFIKFNYTWKYFTFCCRFASEKKYQLQEARTSWSVNGLSVKVQ